MNIKEWIEETHPEVIVLVEEEYDQAILGIVEKINFGPVVCYDFHKLIDGAVDLGMSREEAVEHVDYNILNSLAGDAAPVVLHRPFG